MKAGFARVKITPPVGTPMTGFGGRDRDHGCEGVHDNVFARALFLDHKDEQALIMAFDICFFGRSDADRYKGAIGRELDLSPRQILFNTSHTHTGPAVGRWSHNGFDAPPDPLYLDDLERATVEAACAACQAARNVSVLAGAARSSLPVKRRKPDGKGGVEWRPYPEGTVCDSLPICLLQDEKGKPVCLLFSVSCHPSTVGGWLISADYPGVATARLDEHLGATASMFLQGAGGDAKARVIADGRDDVDVCWRSGNWNDVANAGQIVASEVIAALKGALRPVEPRLTCASIEMSWPLAPHVGREGFARILTETEGEPKPSIRRLWAQRMLTRLDRGETLPSAAPITAHGMQLGPGLRLVGIEGEAVAELGLLMRDFYRGGVTFPMGYTDGAQLYLPTSVMIDEGGYEVDSYYEYGFPAPLKKGMEAILTNALSDLRRQGVE